MKQRTERFYNNINSWRINPIEGYATTIAIIRNMTIIIKTREKYYLVDRIKVGKLRLI